MAKYRIELFRTMKADYGEIIVEAETLADARAMAEEACDGNRTDIRWECADEADEIGITDIVEEV